MTGTCAQMGWLACHVHAVGPCRPPLAAAPAGFTANKISADEKSKILQAMHGTAWHPRHGTVLHCMLQHRTQCGCTRIGPCLRSHPGVLTPQLGQEAADRQWEALMEQVLPFARPPLI